jgi:MscS family membrane protein
MSSVSAWFGAYGWVAQVFAVVLVTLIIGSIVRRFVRHLIARSKATHVLLDDALFEALDGPARGLVWVVGLTFAAEVAPAADLAGEQAEYLISYIPGLRNLGILGMLTWFLLRFARGYEDHYIEYQQAKGEPTDVTLVHAVGKLVRASVAITATLVGLQTIGIDTTGLLAFGGVGGLAVGLAAQDLLANVFGGVTIYLDRPFSVGDWIRSPDQEVEGTVEQIGWRRTVIRTFDKRPLYVPNSAFTKISVENPSRMRNRRIYETIGVRYDDVNRLAPILTDVRAYLQSSPHIDTSQTLMVNFNQFGASSLDFFVYCFTRTTVWTEYHQVKEEVLLHISSIIEGHEAEIAFPTRTLHVAGGVQLAGVPPFEPS